MTNKTDFKARSITTHKRETLVKTKRSIQQEDLTFTNTFVLRNKKSFKIHETKIGRIKEMK